MSDDNLCGHRVRTLRFTWVCTRPPHECCPNQHVMVRA